jgi:hypothetical protein
MRDRPCANKYTAPAASQYQQPKHTPLSKQQTHSLCKQSLHLSVSPPTARKHSLVSVALFPSSQQLVNTTAHTMWCVPRLYASLLTVASPTNAPAAPLLLSMQKPNMRASLSVICLMACLMLSGMNCTDCQHLQQLSRHISSLQCDSTAAHTTSTDPCLLLPLPLPHPHRLPCCQAPGHLTSQAAAQHKLGRQLPRLQRCGHWQRASSGPAWSEPDHGSGAAAQQRTQSLCLPELWCQAGWTQRPSGL